MDILCKAIVKANGEDGLTQLAQTKAFQPVVKKNISSALEVLEKRWNDGKFGLYAMTFLNQSRSQYEVMRHLPCHLPSFLRQDSLVTSCTCEGVRLWG